MARKAQKTGKARASASSRRRALPRPGDPYVKGDGSIIYPDSNEDIGFDDPRTMNVKPSEFRSNARNDMNVCQGPVSVMNACAAVLAYTMLGISDREISLTLKLRDEQLKKIREHDAYAQLFNAFQGEMINVNSASLTSRIAGYAHSALDTVAFLHKGAKKEEVRFGASKDLLDRAGTRIADQAERDKGKPVGLRITILEEDGKHETKVDIGV